MKVKIESEVAQSCPTLSDPMDCSLPGSSVHGIFQARVLEWGAIAFSALLFTWGQTMVEVMNGDLPQKIPWMYCYTQCPQPCSRPPPTHAFIRDSWTPTGKCTTVSCGVTIPFFWVLVNKVLLCPPGVYFPVLCKCWQHYGGANGDLLQEDLCHTHTQSPCPCGRPLSTCPSTGDAQIQFRLSLCGVPGSWYTQGLFEPSEHLWREWGLILNMNSPLLPSCWGFSFGLGHGVSPHSHSSANCLS